MRPEPPRAEAAPVNRRRWVPVVAATAAALVVGVVIGIVRAAGDDDSPGRAAAPRSSASTTSSPPVVVVPSLTGSPTGATGSAVFDPRLAPMITKLSRTKAGVDLTWTLPAGSTSPVVVFLDDGEGRRALAAVPAGRRAVTLAQFPTGKHCVRLSTVASTPSGDTVFGLSNKRCTTR